MFVDAERREGRSVGAPVFAGVGCLVGCRIRGGNFSARSTTDVCLRSELQRKLRGLAAAGGEISFLLHFTISNSKRDPIIRRFETATTVESFHFTGYKCPEIAMIVGRSLLSTQLTTSELDPTRREMVSVVSCKSRESEDN